MILVGLGGNLPTSHGGPQATLEAALVALEASGVRVLQRSRFYRTAPVPPSGQPWFVNAVAAVATALGPAALLNLLLDIERRFGRVRGEPNAARTLDLDLLAYDDLVTGGDGPVLPHPRLAERAFVLLPLAEVAPEWRHPLTGRSAADLIAALPSGQTAEPLAEV